MAFAAERPQINRVTTVTTTYAMNDDSAVILADATGGAFTVTTPDATSVKTGVVYTVVKIDSSANAVTVDGSGAQTINGAATVSLSTQYQSITIASNGANWYVTAIGLDQAAAHIADASDAHDASAISILDTAGDFTATDVEGALAELQSDNEAHDAAADPHTGYVLESLFDAQGDMLVATADNTPAKLTVGSIRQGLYVQTASPKVAWATPAAFIGSSRSSNITSAAGTVYVGPFGTTATTEANANVPVPVACRAFNLHVFGTSNTLDGTLVCTVRKNGAGTALTVTITAGSTTMFSDTTNVVQFAAGDKICLETTENATTGTINIAWSLALAPDLA